MSFITYNMQANKLAEYLNYEIPNEFNNTSNSLKFTAESGLRKDQIKQVASIAFDHLLGEFEKGKRESASLIEKAKVSLKNANLDVSSYSIKAGGMTVIFSK